MSEYQYWSGNDQQNSGTLAINEDAYPASDFIQNPSFVALDSQLPTDPSSSSNIATLAPHPHQGPISAARTSTNRIISTEKAPKATSRKTRATSLRRPEGSKLSSKVNVGGISADASPLESMIGAGGSKPSTVRPRVDKGKAPARTSKGGAEAASLPDVEMGSPVDGAPSGSRKPAKTVGEKKKMKAGSSGKKTRQPVVPRQPKWSVPKAQDGRTVKKEMMDLDEGPFDLRPRVWSSSQEELVSALPELAKPANNVYWHLTATPVIFLEAGDGGTACFQVPGHQQSAEIVLTRDFVCSVADAADFPTQALDTVKPTRRAGPSRQKPEEVAHAVRSEGPATVVPQKLQSTTFASSGRDEGAGAAPVIGSSTSGSSKPDPSTQPASSSTRACPPPQAASSHLPKRIKTEVNLDALLQMPPEDAPSEQPHRTGGRPITVRNPARQTAPHHPGPPAADVSVPPPPPPAASAARPTPKAPPCSCPRAGGVVTHRVVCRQRVAPPPKDPLIRKQLPSGIKFKRHPAPAQVQPPEVVGNAGGPSAPRGSQPSVAPPGELGGPSQVVVKQEPLGAALPWRFIHYQVLQDFPSRIVAERGSSAAVPPGQPVHYQKPPELRTTTRREAAPAVPPGQPRDSQNPTNFLPRTAARRESSAVVTSVQPFHYRAPPDFPPRSAARQESLAAAPLEQPVHYQSPQNIVFQGQGSSAAVPFGHHYQSPQNFRSQTAVKQESSAAVTLAQPFHYQTPQITSQVAVERGSSGLVTPAQPPYYRTLPSLPSQTAVQQVSSAAAPFVQLPHIQTLPNPLSQMAVEQVPLAAAPFGLFPHIQTPPRFLSQNTLKESSAAATPAQLFHSQTPPDLLSKTEVKQVSSAASLEQHLRSKPPPSLPLQTNVNETNVNEEIPAAPQGTPTVPTNLPPEVQALIDAFIDGVPVVVVASRAALQGWDISVAPEFAYSYLGFFRLRRLQETRVACPPMEVAPGCTAGRVKWCFRCEWEPGEDEAISSLTYVPQPWWIARTDLAPLTRFPTTPSEEEINQDEESDARYLALRMASLNYRYRHEPLSLSYYSFLPDHVLAPRNPYALDEGFPAGWLCMGCGRINYQVLLRHRRCGSSFCRGTPLETNCIPSLEDIREPQQAAPLSRALDIYPKGVEAYHVRWADEMRTYRLVVEGDGGFVVRHIFTLNSPLLQRDATKLLRDFQEQVHIERKVGGTSPFFEYTVGTASNARRPPANTWETAPPCVSEARDLLAFYCNGYGEQSGLAVSALSAIAWVTAGTRRAASLLRGKTSPTILMCLGSDTVISLAPRAGLAGRDAPPAAAPGPSRFDGDGDAVMEDVMLERDDARAIGEDDALGMDQDATGGPDIAPQAASQLPKSTIQLALVHGDAAVLSGEDFEYSIKRSGTGILLIASTES